MVLHCLKCDSINLFPFLLVPPHWAGNQAGEKLLLCHQDVLIPSYLCCLQQLGYNIYYIYKIEINIGNSVTSKCIVLIIHLFSQENLLQNSAFNGIYANTRALNGIPPMGSNTLNRTSLMSTGSREMMSGSYMGMKTF